MFQFQCWLFEDAHAAGVGEVEVGDCCEGDASWGGVFGLVHGAVVDGGVAVLAVDFVEGVGEGGVFAVLFEEGLFDLGVFDEPAEGDAYAEDERVGLWFPELVEVVEEADGVLAGFEVDIRDPRRGLDGFDVEGEFGAPEPFVAHAGRGFVEETDRDGSCFLGLAEFGCEDMLVAAVAAFGGGDVRLIALEPVVPDFAEDAAPCAAEGLFGCAAELVGGVDAVAVEAVADAVGDAGEVGDVEGAESLGDVFAFDDNEPVGLHHIGCGLGEHAVWCDADGAAEVLACDVADGCFEGHCEFSRAVDVAVRACEFEAHFVDGVDALDGVDGVDGFEDFVVCLDVLVWSREYEGDAWAFFVCFPHAAAGFDAEVLCFVTRCDATG